TPDAVLDGVEDEPLHLVGRDVARRAGRIDEEARQHALDRRVLHDLAVRVALVATHPLERLVERVAGTDAEVPTEHVDQRIEGDRLVDRHAAAFEERDRLAVVPAMELIDQTRLAAARRAHPPPRSGDPRRTPAGRPLRSPRARACAPRTG